MFAAKRLVLAGVLALGLSGCASMTSSRVDLRDIAENEGVVFGSFLIDLDAGEEDGSAWEFWKGQKAGDATYAAAFAKTGFNPIKPRYSIRATPGQEAVFIKKLQAGQYELEKVSKEGFTNLELNLEGVTFRVAAGQTTYIGKLTLRFPSRIMTGTPARLSVSDSQRETTEALRGEYGESLSNAVKEFATVR